MPSSTDSHFLKGLHEVAQRYDSFVFDIWGVLHNGHHVFPTALEALQHLKQLNKPAALLSNSPRLSEHVTEQLAHLGLPQELYSHILTSGSMASTLIDQWIDQEGPHCLFMGHDTHKHILEPYNLVFVQTPEEADFIYNSGPEDLAIKLSSYQNILTQAQAFDLKMFCTNPDLEVVIGSQKELCAGTLAQFYHNIGGAVFFTGKPHAKTYEMLFENTGFQPEKTLCIGDSMAHDIVGGNQAGCDTALVFSGIHGDHPSFGTEPLKQLIHQHDVTPTYAMHALTW
ncbi:TIGR01459 family HAD-type hydrolase [Alphaproteobacteria bacterium]|nr:TIGR01459 family HAD-type hydrolase [Alphaproteobacteria bacterium]